MTSLLIETFKMKNADVNALLRQYNEVTTFNFPANRAKAASAAQLSMLRAPEAVDRFLEDLGRDKGAPEDLSNKHATSYRVTEVRAVSEQILGLGDLGDPRAADFLKGVVRGEYIEDEWDEITDWMVELEFRQDAALALVRVGHRPATEDLLEMAKNGVIDGLERRAAALEKHDRPMRADQRYQFNWMMAQAYANLAGAEGINGVDSLIEQTQQPALEEKFRSFLPMVKKGAKCLEAGGPTEQATCFDNLLSDNDELVREKAAYELSRLPAAAAGPVVAKHLAHAELDTREILTFAAYRVPHKSMVSSIDDVLEAEKNRRGTDYRIAHTRLRLLRAWLGHNVDVTSEAEIQP